MTTRADKRRLVKEIHEFMADWRAKTRQEFDISMGCFYWSCLAHTKLKEHGFKSVISAGSLSWPRIKLSEDDGKIATHFSYMWEPMSEATLLALREGRMPEMHVWVVLPAEQEIIDLTTGYLKKQCERMGMKWSAPDPPYWIWRRISELPKGVYYDPSPSAVALVRRLVQKEWGVA